jgi:hypothetical protein
MAPALHNRDVFTKSLYEGRDVFSAPPMGPVWVQLRADPINVVIDYARVVRQHPEADIELPLVGGQAGVEVGVRPVGRTDHPDSH